MENVRDSARRSIRASASARSARARSCSAARSFTRRSRRSSTSKRRHDYEKILARQDAAADSANENVVGNLAETYMMLGPHWTRRSRCTARRSAGGAAETSTWYGFAVALDRDERTQQGASRSIQSLGKEQRDAFHRKVIAGDTFFVQKARSTTTSRSPTKRSISMTKRSTTGRSTSHPAHTPSSNRAPRRTSTRSLKKKRKAGPFESTLARHLAVKRRFRRSRCSPSRLPLSAVWAQSKKYPPVAPDKELQEEQPLGPVGRRAASRSRAVRRARAATRSA